MALASLFFSLPHVGARVVCGSVRRSASVGVCLLFNPLFRARARASERETFSALYKADGNFEVEAIFLRSAKMRFARGKARGFYGVCTVTAFSEDRAFLVISLRRRSIYIY